jgi:tetrahedral aminopeptidase
MDYSWLRQLVEAPGISGREEQVRALVAEQFGHLTSDIITDAMGSLIAHIPGKGPRVALIAHMDEIGFLVSKIEPEGFIRVMPVGGIDPRVFGAQKVVVHGRRELVGIVGSTPPHLLKKADGQDRKDAVPIEESFIDLGLPAEQVVALVKVGDPVTFGTACWDNEHAFFAKALDDRVGLFVMLAAVRKAARIDCDLFLIASTQEEYGLRGAGPATFTVKPHIAVALEGTVASDTPGLKLPANIMATGQGKGPEIRLSDKGMISHRGLADFLAEVAESGGIAYQVIVKNTGSTDAAKSQTAGEGVRVCTVSVPTRYIHAPVAMVRKTDVARTVDLVAAFLERVSQMALDR